MRNLISSAKYRIRALFWAAQRLGRSMQLRERYGVPIKYVNMLRNVEACSGSIRGKKVLEIGCDFQGQFLQYLTSQRELAEAMGVNPLLEKDIVQGNYSLNKEDARNLPFNDDRFDVILSISAFEHVQNFDVALAEMHRVLKPGGYLFTEFAPIWSGVWGHHLWLYHGNEVRDWKNTPLPPYAHLLMPEDELRLWVSEKYRDESLTGKILDFVYRSDEQNHLFFSDYEHIVANSAFETLFFVGFTDLPFSEGYEVEDPKTVLNKLRNVFPDKSGFGYHGISMLLTKS